MTIEELCKRSYDTAVAKGWHEEKRTFGEAIALFHSEVSEALECYRDPEHQPGDIWFSEEGKPEGIVIELADLLIRIGDTAVDKSIPIVGHMRLDMTIGCLGANFHPRTLRCPDCSHARCLPNTQHNPKLEEVKKLAIPDVLAEIHGDLSDAFRGEDDSDRADGLCCAMGDVGILCIGQGWDLEKAVLMKMEYNESRPHRHGGKRA